MKIWQESAQSTMSEDTAVVPSSTLYINNLEDSLNKNVLKKNLYLLFSQYGKVVDVVACKGLKLRGQAWITFENAEVASDAMRGKQGFHFYDKQLRISYAKEQSKRVAAKLGLPAPNSNATNNSLVEELGKRKFNSNSTHKHFDDDNLNMSV